MPAHAQTGGEGNPGETPPITPASVINGVQIGFAVENSTTTIWIRVCGSGPNFQIGVESLSSPGVQLFNRTAASGGCSPSASSWWRLVYGVAPGPAKWRLYGTANEAVLPLDVFLQRAARAECQVTGLGAGVCTPSSTPPPTSAPTGALEAPAAGASVQGVVAVSGWAADAGSWTDAGVDLVQVWANGVLSGVASYGQPRPDVASAVGDARFTGSGYNYQLDTKALTNGPATVEVRYRSRLTGQFTTLSRAVTIANPVVGNPVPEPIPPPPDPRKEWVVPYYAQGNPAWGGKTMRTCGYGIAGSGCALTSLAMLFTYYGADKNPDTLNTCLGGAACPLQWGSSTVRQCSGSKLTWVGRENLSGVNLYARMAEELKARPVILELRRADGSMHFVVVVGGSGTSPAGYTVNDPGIRNGARSNLANTLRIFKGYQPAGLRIYRGTPAITADDLAVLDAPAPLEPPALTLTQVIAGSVALNRYTESTMVLELAAQSGAGAVTAMRVWTEGHPSEIWQPFAPYVEVPLDTAYYAQFRDVAGNVSAIASPSAPGAPPDIEDQVMMLPFVRR